MNWWYSGTKTKRNALQTLSDQHILEFIQQHELARKDFDEAFAACSLERQYYLQELLDITSKRDKSPVMDAVEKADHIQKKGNRLAYFHGKPRKKRSS